MAVRQVKVMGKAIRLNFIVDSDGNYITDSNGNYIAVTSYK